MAHHPTGRISVRFKNAFITGLMAIAALGGCSGSGSGTYTVKSIVDGDTLDVTDSDGATHRVRLIGIDTPEKGQCGYRGATAHLEHLLPVGEKVELRPNPEEGAKEADKYGRLLRYAAPNAGYGSDEFDFANQGQLTDGAAVARYDSRDGYDKHPQEDLYHELDAEDDPFWDCVALLPVAGDEDRDAGDDDWDLDAHRDRNGHVLVVGDGVRQVSTGRDGVVTESEATFDGDEFALKFGDGELGVDTARRVPGADLEFVEMPAEHKQAIESYDPTAEERAAREQQTAQDNAEYERGEADGKAHAQAGLSVNPKERDSYLYMSGYRLAYFDAAIAAGMSGERVTAGMRKLNDIEGTGGSSSGGEGNWCGATKDGDGDGVWCEGQ